MSKAIELAKETGASEHRSAARVFFMTEEMVEAFYAAAEAAGEKKALDRLTAGVEVPKAAFVQYEQPRFYKDEGMTKHWHSPEQLLEHGAAQRLAGAREERKEHKDLLLVKNWIEQYGLQILDVVSEMKKLKFQEDIAIRKSAFNGNKREVKHD